MSLVILIPLLPLLAALFVWAAGRRLHVRGARIGAIPIAAAFAGAGLALKRILRVLQTLWTPAKRDGR